MKDRSSASQGWVMYLLGQLTGQQARLFDKATAIADRHEKVRSKELDPTKEDTQSGLEELVELTKKFQNNASLLMSHVFSWRLDWKHEHGQVPDAPNPKKESEEIKHE